MKGQDLSFTEIAKVVGERWQVLPAEERESCESQANAAKEKYYAGLAEYKKTPQYAAYQQYLEDFKAKHAVPTKGLSSSSALASVSHDTLVTESKGKRSKLQTERSTSVRNTSYEQGERVPDRRLSSTHVEYSSAGHHRQEPSPSIGASHLSKGPSPFSKPTSPVAQSMSGFNSPQIGERHYSPTATPLQPANVLKEPALDIASGNPARDANVLPDINSPYHSSSYTHGPHQAAASTASPHHSYGVHYQSSVNPVPHSRRPIREASRLPPLSRDETTWSSESSHSGYNLPLAGYSEHMLSIDQVKSLRILPQPVPNMGSVTSPLDRLPVNKSPPIQHQPYESRAQGPFAVLLRAGELAARAADENDKKNETPL